MYSILHDKSIFIKWSFGKIRNAKLDLEVDVKLQLIWLSIEVMVMILGSSTSEDKQDQVPDSDIRCQVWRDELRNT